MRAAQTGYLKAVADSTRIEMIPVPRVRQLLALAVPLTAVYLGLFVFQAIYGRNGIASVAGWAFLSVVLLFVGVGAVLFNFRRLIVTITPQLVMVRFGVLKYQVLWKDVSDCCMNESDMIRQSSTGIRLRRYEGSWQMCFTVADNPVVRLKKRQGFFKELVFSTNNPIRVKSSAGF